MEEVMQGRDLGVIIRVLRQISHGTIQITLTSSNSNNSSNSSKINMVITSSMVGIIMGDIDFLYGFNFKYVEFVKKLFSDF